MSNSINIEQWLEDNNGLFVSIAKKFNVKSSKFSMEDLIQEGKLIAITAIPNFDPNKGVKLSSFIYTAVYRGLRDFTASNVYDLKYSLSAQKRDYKKSLKEDGEKTSRTFGSVNKANALRLNSSKEINSMPIPSGEPCGYEYSVRKEQLSILKEEMEKMTPRDADIIKLIHIDGQNEVQVAEKYKLTRQRVNQIKKKAFSEISRRMKARLGSEILF